MGLEARLLLHPRQPESHTRLGMLGLDSYEPGCAAASFLVEEWARKVRIHVLHRRRLRRTW